MKRLKTGINEEKRRHYNVIASAVLRTGRYGIKGKLSASLGNGHHICRKMTKKTGDAALPRKKRQDAIGKATLETVQNHWTSEGISHVIPLKKRVKKGQPFHVLDCTYTEAYRQFKTKHPTIKIGYVSFIKCKP